MADGLFPKDEYHLLLVCISLAFEVLRDTWREGVYLSVWRWGNTHHSVDRLSLLPPISILNIQYSNTPWALSAIPESAFFCSVFLTVWRKFSVLVFCSVGRDCLLPAGKSGGKRSVSLTFHATFQWILFSNLSSASHFRDPDISHFFQNFVAAVSLLFSLPWFMPHPLPFYCNEIWGRTGRTGGKRMCSIFHV